MNGDIRLAESRGWTSGLGNLLAKDLSSWWSTGRILKHSLGWVLLINGVVFIIPMVLASVPGAGETDPFFQALEAYFNVSALAAAIGVILIMQDAIIGERENGILAWILSHPVSRLSILASKVLSASLGILMSALFLPGLLAYGQVFALSGAFPPLGWYGVSLGIVGTQLVFYVSLMILLGTVFRQRLGATGLALGFLLAGGFLPALMPELGRLFPWQTAQIALLVTVKQELPLEMLLSVGMTGAWIIIFLGLAAILFRNVEL